MRITMKRIYLSVITSLFCLSTLYANEVSLKKHFVELTTLIAQFSIPFEESDGLFLSWDLTAPISGLEWESVSEDHRLMHGKPGKASVMINGKPSHEKDGVAQKQSWTLLASGNSTGINQVTLETSTDDGSYIDVPAILDMTSFDLVLMGCDRDNSTQWFRKLYYYHNDFAHGWIEVRHGKRRKGGASTSYTIHTFPPEGDSDLDRNCRE